MRETLGQLDFLVVQDMYHSTETAELADLLLPAAGWGEKEGTFINSERRVGLIKKVCRAPGQALADFHIFKLVAHYYGCGELFAAWESPEAVFQILKQLSAGRPCDITGIDDYRMLDESRGVQWPYPVGEPRPDPGTAALYRRPVLPPGRPRPVPLRGAAAAPRAAGRRVSRFNSSPAAAARRSGTRRRGRPSRTSSASSTRATLTSRSIPPTPTDLGLSTGRWAVVESRRGPARVRAFVTPTVPAGQLFLPMHDGSTNLLTDSVFDPESRQPAYKACAARVRPAVDGEIPNDHDALPTH